MKENNRQTSRRKVLKTIGASTIGLSTAGTVTAAQENQFRRDLERARRLREKTGDNDKFVKYLRKKGYPVWTTSTQSPMQSSHWGEEDGLSTSRLYDGNMTGTLNITAWHRNCNPDPYDIYFEYTFDLNTGDNAWGVESKDGFSIGWPDNTFEIENDSWVNSSNVEFYDRSNMLNGLSFKYHDAVHIDRNDSDWGYGGVHVRTESGYSDSTTIAGKYVHTYKSLELCGFSVDAGGGMSWDFCANGEKDYMGHTQKDWSEADHNWANCM